MTTEQLKYVADQLAQHAAKNRMTPQSTDSYWLEMARCAETAIERAKELRP